MASFPAQMASWITDAHFSFVVGAAPPSFSITSSFACEAMAWHDQHRLLEHHVQATVLDDATSRYWA